jgi:hypothetical protein
MTGPTMTGRSTTWEVRNLLEHRQLIRTNYPPTEVYLDYEAPVIAAQADLGRPFDHPRGQRPILATAAGAAVAPVGPEGG